MRSRKKKWAAPFIAEHPEIIGEKIPEGSRFDFLEVGCGKGDFIIGLAKLSPDKLFLAIEKDRSVASLAAKKALEGGIGNVYFLLGDLDYLLEGLSGQRLEAIYLNFPDPWPKLRHHKRRLTQRTRLLAMDSLLKEGGYIRLTTDNADLFEYSLLEAAEAGLEAIEVDRDAKAKEPQTEYERKFRELGISINRCKIRRKA